MFEALHAGITGKALQQHLIHLSLWNPRDYATNKHKSVDDHPYGGGPGMVMMAEPLKAALHAAKNAAPIQPKTIYLSPQGKPFDQAIAEKWAALPALLFLAGRYEGIDERIIEQDIDEEWSIGDYILTGGELAAMVMIDTITRLLPGVVGDPNSVTQDSLSSGLLKYPQYSRPECVENASVPAVLLRGHHQHIERWRLKMSLGKTWLKRPDLLAKKKLSAEEQFLLNEFIEEYAKISSKKS
jgi:tRNA (guanine37-N1)-methyltransferase